MSPDEIHDVLGRRFSKLVAAKRHSPDGWSFSYAEQRRGARIIAATRSTRTARTRLLRAVSYREGQVGDYVPFDGGEEELCRIIAEEIALFQQPPAQA